MKTSELEQFLKKNNIESNFSISQPWVLWRMKTSKISLNDVQEQINRLEDFNESSNDD